MRVAWTEAEIIGRIRRGFLGGETLLDDCGDLPLPGPGERLLTTTDLMESGQHFCLDWHPPELLGRKLLMINLSDLDASGARPLGFTLTLALGRDLDPNWIGRLLEGLARSARDLGVPVIGGDTVGRAEGLGLGITAFGAAKRWLGRSGLRPGDRIFVDQMPGASLRGLRKLQGGLRWNPELPDPDVAAHLDPHPNLGLGLRLADMVEVHAAIDLSDGLSKDLRMLAEASGVSIILEAELSPEALVGGEDYARCFGSSLDQETLEGRLGLRLFPVGRVVGQELAPLLIYDGRVLRPVPDQSFDHFRPDA